MVQNATDRFTMRINPELKEQAMAVFEDMGIDFTTGITMFLKKVVKTQSIPFELGDDARDAAIKRLLAELDEAYADVQNGKYLTLDELAKRGLMVAENKREYRVKKG